MVFRDYAQGAFRMRGIGKGQTIQLLVVPEIEDRIKTQVMAGAGAYAAHNSFDLRGAQFLKDVISWLNINSMRVDGIQFNLLCEQSVGNVWRKRAFAGLALDFRMIDSSQCPTGLNRSLQVFRERVDFEIENSVPSSSAYSAKIGSIINEHNDLLQNEADKAVATKILSIIEDEERRTDEIKQSTRKKVAVAPTLIDTENNAMVSVTGAVAAEQSFNREQVQEQEQVIKQCTRDNV